ncbi:Hypothetical predicted protein [Mytilus galloprovincialis]|uniref:Uncharacterized protein n=1 Tax=Mytilus galloprovincialis TaxID=29158 RepID=A0A8B6HQD0_MYTGA|nr:Hypothetical predicted protein [Mytilus galloprovincialis]
MSDEFEKLVPYLPCLPDDDVIKMILIAGDVNARKGSKQLDFIQNDIIDTHISSLFEDYNPYFDIPVRHSQDSILSPRGETLNDLCVQTGIRILNGRTPGDYIGSTKMQNNREMEAVSIRLYKYLCEEVVGSKSIVRYRRLYYKLHDDILSDNSREVISSGSKAEGLDLPGSDLDMMFCLKSWKVYEDKPKDKENVLLLDTDNALPGFALLKKADSSSFPCYTTKTSDGYLISNEDFVKLLWQDMRQAVPVLEKHGPALTN